jgi:hypothetical protein
MTTKKYIQTEEVMNTIKGFFKKQIELDNMEVDSVDACVDLCNEISRLAKWENEDLKPKFVGDLANEIPGGVFR